MPQVSSNTHTSLIRKKSSGMSTGHGNCGKGCALAAAKSIHTLASWEAAYILLTMTESGECPKCVENKARTDKTVDV
jgi:hypothetical protein